ncbi:MAG: hypothetical protein PUB61_05875, partial [Bacteroidales bacterium]|nr:hypothetical protein [Bacteroidales bacterium]
LSFIGYCKGTLRFSVQGALIGYEKVIYFYLNNLLNISSMLLYVSEVNALTLFIRFGLINTNILTHINIHPDLYRFLQRKSDFPSEKR